MSRNYVIINGVNSLTIKGLAINIMPPITKPLMRTMREEIDGRNGDINTELGYQAYDKQIEVGLFGNYDIDEIIAFFNSKGTIVFSDENDKFYNFQILDKIDFAKMVKFRTAMINIHCQPFKYPLTDTPVDVAYEYVESTGENLTLNNTEASSLKMDLKGNTSQASYTGKNLLNVDRNTTTQNGLVFTINEDKTILVTGTFSSTTYFNLHSGKYPIEANTTYTLGGTVSSSARLRIRLFDSNQTQTREQYLQSTSGYTFTTANNEAYYDVFIVMYALSSPVLFKPMLVKGSTLGDYEPYVGEIPSPNPQFPQPVEVVTGNNVVKVCGKNIFDKSKLTYILNYYVDSSGNLAYGSYNKLAYVKLQPNKTYTLSQTKISSNTNRVGLFSVQPIQQVGLQGTLIGTFNSGSPIDCTFTTTNDAVYLAWTYCNTNSMGDYTEQDMIDSIQIEVSSTASEYEPYQEQSYEINLGKNLFDKDTMTTRIYGYLMENLTTWAYASGGYSIKIPCEPNTNYTISANNTNETIFRAGVTDSDDTPVSGTTISVYSVTRYANTNTPIYVTSGANAKYIVIQVGVDTASDTFNTLQVEKGNQATSYSAYFPPIELCIIGDYQDTIKYENEKWYLYKEIGKNFLDGSVSWTENQEQTYVKQYLMSGSDLDSNIASGTYYIMSDHFKFKYGNPTASTNEDYMWVYQKRVVLDIRKTIVADRNALKTWMGDNKPIFYYRLETPTNTEITNATLISQLNAIKQAMSYSGQTNITQDNSDKPFMIDATALKKGSDTAVLNNIGNIYSKPVIALQGTGIVNIYNDGVQAFQVDMSEENNIIIDTEMMEAYTPTKLANRQVTGDYSKFMIDTGSHDVKFDGELTEATITRYVRWL